MAGLRQVEGAFQRFGSMINTSLILLTATGLIWSAGKDAEKRDAADRLNAAEIVRVERDITKKIEDAVKEQDKKWTAHDELHKNRLAEVKSLEARSDERFKGIETDNRKLSGLADNLNYRLTSNEQATSGIAQTVREIQQSLSQQSGDLREIKVILERMEKGKPR